MPRMLSRLASALNGAVVLGVIGLARESCPGYLHADHPATRKE